LPRAELLRGDAVTPEAVDWLWEGWLAAGKLHILGGQPGTGKTTIALALAASITTGAEWPDGKRADLGTVVVWSGEDDPADTLAPRLRAAGADMQRVHFVQGVREGHEQRPFNPSQDVGALRTALAGLSDVRLLVVDPIVSAVSGDSHKNAEVRRGLQPLVDLAREHRCALLGITHFTKGTAGREPVERITGSLAFGALARLVLVTAKGEAGNGEPARRFLARAKSNIGPDGGGFIYDLSQGSCPTSPASWRPRCSGAPHWRGRPANCSPVPSNRRTTRRATPPVSCASCCATGRARPRVSLPRPGARGSRKMSCIARNGKLVL